MQSDAQSAEHQSPDLIPPYVSPLLLLYSTRHKKNYVML